MTHALLYTSRKLIAPEREALEVADIVAVSHAHNAAAGITGGLINVRRAFAQFLEGPIDVLDDLMTRIVDDTRHEDVSILRRGPVARRKLPFWTMAYSGHFLFVDNRVEPLVGARHTVARHDIDELEDMIVQFALNGSIGTIG